MTTHEFLNSKEPNTFIVPEEWLEEYANYKVNQILKQSIDVRGFQDTHRFIKLIDYKEEIINSIKNK